VATVLVLWLTDYSDFVPLIDLQPVCEGAITSPALPWQDCLPPSNASSDRPGWSLRAAFWERGVIYFF